MLEFRSIKMFLLKYIPQIGHKFFLISRIKKAVPCTYVINDLNGEEIVGTFMKKNCKRLMKKNLE